MTLIPIIEKTQICLVHCGKEVCKCNPPKRINKMKAQELRIGNFTKQGQILELRENVAIVGYKTNTVYLRKYLVSYGDLLPIPLTEEILLKCPKVDKLSNQIFSNYFRIHLKRNKYLIISDLGAPNFMMSIIETDFDNHNNIEDCVNIHNWDFEKDLKLHQLQNLYFALTGEELEINL